MRVACRARLEGRWGDCGPNVCRGAEGIGIGVNFGTDVGEGSCEAGLLEWLGVEGSLEGLMSLGWL